MSSGWLRLHVSNLSSRSAWFMVYDRTRRPANRHPLIAARFIPTRPSPTLRPSPLTNPSPFTLHPPPHPSPITPHRRTPPTPLQATSDFGYPRVPLSSGYAPHRLLRCGAVAQLGEHLVCNQGVAGSNPVRSTHTRARRQPYAHRT